MSSHNFLLHPSFIFCFSFLWRWKKCGQW